MGTNPAGEKIAIQSPIMSPIETTDAALERTNDFTERWRSPKTRSKRSRGLSCIVAATVGSGSITT